MALALGDENPRAEFVFPTSEEMGHPTDGGPRTVVSSILDVQVIVPQVRWSLRAREKRVES